VTAPARIGALALLVVAAAALAAPAPAGERSGAVDPGRLPQTTVLPSSSTARFHRRMAALWRGIVEDSPASARPAFFPESAYEQVKQIPNAAADYRDRLLANYRADIHAAHLLLGRGASGARLVAVRVPSQWAWITPGYCYNRVGYWHAPGSRLVYRLQGRTRSFGIFSLISWRGEWYVVHLAVWNRPGTVDDPSAGVGSFGPAGGC
jgi:hypothetical protein